MENIIQIFSEKYFFTPCTVILFNCSLCDNRTRCTNTISNTDAAVIVCTIISRAIRNGILSHYDV